ncbi:MAG: type II toxin-antitoxin system VapC family toxin [Rhodomicrobium sp.]
MSFLLDTNAVSEWTKPRPDPGLAAWLDSVDEDRTFLSVITLAEIRFGIERLAPGRRRDGLGDWLKHELIPRFDGRVLLVDPGVADAWAMTVSACAGLGRPMGIMDGFIAATAIVHDLTLVTRNTVHFDHAPVRLLNPWTNSA